MCLKPGHVQPADLRSGDLVELPKELVAHVGCVAYLGDQAAELEFDDVVDLLLADLLHGSMLLIINCLGFL